MPNDTYRQALEMALSWGRVFAAALVAQYAAGVTEPSMLLNAGIAALIPVILRWLDPMDTMYGRGSNS